MSLPLNFDAALSALYSPKPLPVYDSVGGWVDGAFVESPLLRRARPIQAVCLAMSPAELELYPQGDVGDGGIGLLTKAELYWRDSGLVTGRTGDGTGDGTDDPATRTTNPATRTTAGANASAPALAPDPAAPVPTPTFAPQATFAPQDAFGTEATLAPQTTFVPQETAGQNATVSRRQRLSRRQRSPRRLRVWSCASRMWTGRAVAIGWWAAA